MKKKSLVLLFLLLTACAPWSKLSGRYEIPSQHFAVVIPEGWMALDTDEYLMLTKDGPFLQYMLIQERGTDQAFGHTQKKLQPSMLPLEAAGVIVDEIASDRAVINFQILENGPALIDGRQGFKIVFTHQAKDGLTLKTVYYGLIAADSFFSLRFSAPQRYYFDKDIAVFEAVMRTFRLGEA